MKKGGGRLSRKLTSKSGKDILKTLERLGFKIARIRKHYIMKRGDIVVPVPFHKKVPKGTIRAIIREAEVTVKEFLEKDP